jgi:carboxymethylenebutenolidase
MPDITIRSGDGGSFRAYVANKRAASGPAVLLAHAMFGVSVQTRELADDLSLLGVAVVCPDLYWRQQPGVELDYTEPGNVPVAAGFLRALDIDRAVDDLKATLAHMRGMASIVGKIGVLGRCLGGRLAWLMMTRSDVDCGVSVYGTEIEKYLGEANNLRRPYLNIVAGRDKFVPPAALQQIRNTLDKDPLAAIRVFPDRDHAFCDVGYPTYHAADALAANEMVAQFLTQHLR